MSKWMIIAATGFIWSTGFAATAALTYVTREPTPVVVAKLPTPPPAPVALVKTMPVARENPVVVLPMMEIVGSLPARAKAKAAPAAPPPHEIHCTDYRPLEQGSSSVQICE
ncbi:MAG TPA: hypothetical protein VGH28_03210 [Polyangiaceae bacterium]|jgi:hypothetical protein